MQKIAAFLLPLVVLFSACKKDVRNPTDDSAHGAITTLTLQFYQGSTLVSEVVFDDPDGPGGANPVRFDDIVLGLGQTYDVQVLLANKTTSPVQDMTPVIRNAGHQHLFFFLPTGISGLAVTRTDSDRTGLPIGLQSRWTTPATAQNGTLRVSLRHIVFGKNENSPPSAGHSDIQVDFAIKFQ